MPCPLLELSSDTTIRTHLSALYDTLLEQNLLRIVEPYSVFEIEYIAQLVDQGRGCLLIFDEPEADVGILCLLVGPPCPECYSIQRTYGAAIDTLEQVGKVVDSLYAKVCCPGVRIL